jgi:hypothetical protein
VRIATSQEVRSVHFYNGALASAVVFSSRATLLVCRPIGPEMGQLDHAETNTADSCPTQQRPVHSTNSSCNSIDSSRHRHSTRSWDRTSSVFSFLVLLHSFQSLLGSAQAAAAAPGPLCVACDDCVTSSCLRICMPSCRTAPTIAEGSDLSTEQCKHKGQDAALDIATAACKLSLVCGRGMHAHVGTIR